MASLVGDVTRDEMSARKSTKCANGGVAKDGTKAWGSTEKGTEGDGTGV